VSTSAFVLVDAVLLIGNHTISEYLRVTLRLNKHGHFFIVKKPNVSLLRLVARRGCTFIRSGCEGHCRLEQLVGVLVASLSHSSG
jgi:hypothetical protein